jgi:DNA-binding NarL/FixJ family response regulator
MVCPYDSIVSTLKYRTPMPTPSQCDSEKRRRIFLVEDHPLFRSGLVAFFESEADLAICGQASNADEALQKLREKPCDAVVLDISLPGVNGMQLLRELREEFPDLPILVISMHDESQYALPALRAGAKGYLTKRQSPDVLVTALRKVLEGETYVSAEFGSQIVYKVLRAQGGPSPLDVLTLREREIFQLIGEGFSSQQIAVKLELSVKTVESHRLHLKEKLGLGDAAELVRLATEVSRHQLAPWAVPAAEPVVRAS